jgi:hypothetical protein
LDGLVGHTCRRASSGEKKRGVTPGEAMAVDRTISPSVISLSRRRVS